MGEVDFQHLRFLIIDDETFMRKIVRTLLLDLGAKSVNGANNGAEGLLMVTNSPARFDMIVCDIHMPEMNGMEFLTALRALPGDRSQTPVLMLTGNDTEDALVSAVGKGADSYLLKPVSRAGLVTHVTAIMRRFNPPKKVAKNKQLRLREINPRSD